MKINPKIATGILVACLAYSAYESRRKSIAIKKLCDFNAYLADLLDRNGVTVNEFDEIAINAIVS